MSNRRQRRSQRRKRRIKHRLRERQWADQAEPMFRATNPLRRRRPDPGGSRYTVQGGSFFETFSAVDGDNTR